MAVADLHFRGFQRLRIMPHEGSVGTWRCRLQTSALPPDPDEVEAPSAHVHLHRTDEGALLVGHLDRLLRAADVDLLGTESKAKGLLTAVASSAD